MMTKPPLGMSATDETIDALCMNATDKLIKKGCLESEKFADKEVISLTEKGADKLRGFALENPEMFVLVSLTMMTQAREGLNRA